MKIRATEEMISQGNMGACLNCGEIQDGGVEPDAEKYTCDNCGEDKVYGLEQLLLMGKLEIEEEEE